MTGAITIILTIGGWIIAGVLAVVGVFNKQSRERRREDEDVASNLIKNLQTTVEVQEKTIAKMQETMEKHTKERNEEMQKLRDQMTHISGRNSMLEDLFKGRDPQMQAFLKEAPMLVEIIKADHELIEENTKMLTALGSAMSKFADSFSKQ